MRKIAGYLTKNRSGKDQKIAQSTHENEYIKPRKTFWRNSKQFLKRQALASAIPFEPAWCRIQRVSCSRLFVSFGAQIPCGNRQAACRFCSCSLHV
ncbi:hypothetical protein EVD32_03150 [Bacteroidales bacterium SW299]|nr:hypothetical protein [Bacteroidales bacterium SW299]